ncbi:hypothetical protein AB0D86_08200 [Streptomyces sp. NPDC048324]|uniref:hypothetical protein n=1 Tax=Streptomyces sp. NPDC048324 TaxID=3157205 RepID=UPI003429D722
MTEQLRVLVAAALGRIVEPVLREGLGQAQVVLADSPAAVRRAVDGRPRYDVVLADLLWNDFRLERSFDGLDVLDTLQELQRGAPAVIAVQGHGGERDLLEEAVDRPDVLGVVHKSCGPGDLIEAVRTAAAGRCLPPARFPTGVDGARPSVHSHFSAGRRGATSARLAGAIASGRATDYRTLSEAARVPMNTANKLVNYLGPLITGRGEHPPQLPLNCQAVFRWCGRHELYILSWCRRYGHRDLAGTAATAPA